MASQYPAPNWIGRLSADQLSLRVLSYQYTNGGDDWHDRNWLVISSRVRTKGLEWHFTDPCLLTSELKDLIRWFGKYYTKKLSACGEYLEPLLNFEQHDETSLHVHLLGEAVGQQHPAFDDRWGGGAFLDIEIDRDSLTQFTEVLKKDLSRFPTRR